MGRARDPTDNMANRAAAECSRQLVAAHLKALGSGDDCRATLTDDVTLTFMETGEVIRGRNAVTELLTYVHHSAFSAPPVVKALFVEAERALLEAEFIGQQTSEFAGIPATGHRVHLPYVVAYDLDAHAIRAMRLYLSMNTLVRQLRET
ncbi:MAG: ester cyclase [Thermomicrobiales bacterium]|nr:ester cyclase [Chloroflexia bacterium]